MLKLLIIIFNDEKKIKGLSKEEYEDPNQIRVTIADAKAPLIILFGPPACGKTMTLVRLARWRVGENTCH